MFDKLKELAQKANQWIEAHWRLVLTTLALIVLMQQCTIGRLRWEVEQLTLHAQAVPAVAHGHSSDSTLTAAGGDSIGVAGTVPADADADEEEESSSLPLLLTLLGIAALTAGAVYMRREGIPPIGLRLSGSLRQQGGDIFYDFKVRNTSRREMELSSPMVSFTARGGTRRFRASMPQLPLTLHPGTGFEASIRLTGLMMSNELFGKRLVAMSCEVNGRRRTTLPRPINAVRANA